MKHLDTDESHQPAYVVRKDSKQQHEKYWPLHKKTNQDLALKVKEIAAMAYFRSRVYLNARDKFIAVKVEKPQLADTLQRGTEISNLSQLVQTHGIEMVSTNNSLLFRILK